MTDYFAVWWNGFVYGIMSGMVIAFIVAKNMRREDH